MAPWPLRGRVSYQRCCIVVPSALPGCFVRTDTAASRRCPCYRKCFYLVRAFPSPLCGAVQVIVRVVSLLWLRGRFAALSAISVTVWNVLNGAYLVESHKVLLAQFNSPHNRSVANSKQFSWHEHRRFAAMSKLS